MTNKYQFDPAQRIWVAPGESTLTYSDGDENEEYLFSVIANAKDVSSNSPELAAAIKDWPSEYHLSPVRHNLLRPFSIGPSDHILELGCGCGAMTRYLGETGAKVVAVEGSRRRAMIAAERCRDLPNVSVYCDNLIDFQADSVFDFVTLIGVLEYANRFIPGPDPVHSCLIKAGSFLNADGALILAIENQLGLKYFNGCHEDHLGIPYFGINGLYQEHDPVTFGRHVLGEKLNESGFPVYDFFFPFPDYKLPGLILSEQALRDTRLNVADLLIHNNGRNYPETHHRAFAEDLTWRVAIRNQLLPDLSNSFLVLGRLGQTNQRKADWLAKMYSRGRRRSCYQVESTISQDSAGRLVVRKEKLYPNAPDHETHWLRHVVANSDYFPGRLLIVSIHEAMAREANVAELAACFDPWLKFLSNQATINADSVRILPEHFVDCIPTNMLEFPSGKLKYFDAEWVSANPIPLAWVAIRGISISLMGCLESHAIGQMTQRQIISIICERNSILLLPSDFEVADHYESRLMIQCHIDSENKPRLANFLDFPPFLTSRLTNHSQSTLRLQDWNRTEVERMKTSVSWRITAPLRVAWNLYLKLIGSRSEKNASIT